MDKTLYDKIQLVKDGDFIYITDTLNTFSKIEKITTLENNFINTKTYRFSRSNFHCIDTPSVCIGDVYFNFYRRVILFFNKKGFMPTQNADENIILYKKINTSNVVITITKKSINFKTSCTLTIVCNHVILFTGDIFDLDDAEIIYKCTLKKFE